MLYGISDPPGLSVESLMFQACCDRFQCADAGHKGIQEKPSDNSVR
jgi:hypothetical protein